jgi:transposase
VRERAKEREAAQSLAQTREQLVGLRTKLINQVHALLAANGRKEKRERLTTAKGLTEGREKYAWSAAEEIQLQVIAAQISSLNEGIKQLDEAISKAGEQLEGFDNLVSIKGIGKRSAALLLSVIGEVRDFASEGRAGELFRDCAARQE